MTGLDTMRARALGEALLELEGAKARGWDVVISSSWCSDQNVWIARSRAPGTQPHAAVTKVGTLLEVLRWAADRSGGAAPESVSGGDCFSAAAAVELSR